MSTYKISINGCHVEEWDSKEGVSCKGAFEKNFKDSKVIQTNELTRKDVLASVTDMIYHHGKVTENDLFDGNEEYFIFTRLEDEEGEELETDINGFLTSYFVWVERVEEVKAINII